MAFGKTRQGANSIVGVGVSSAAVGSTVGDVTTRAGSVLNASQRVRTTAPIAVRVASRPPSRTRRARPWRYRPSIMSLAWYRTANGLQTNGLQRAVTGHHRRPTRPPVSYSQRHELAANGTCYHGRNVTGGQGIAGSNPASPTKYTTLTQ